jgi:hypothetical protein
MSPRQERRPLWWLPPAVATVVSLAILAPNVPLMRDAYERAGFDDPYFSYAVIGVGGTLIALAISFLVRNTTAQIVYAIVAVALSLTVGFSWLVYEEWLEYQPGGRGYFSP